MLSRFHILHRSSSGVGVRVQVFCQIDNQIDLDSLQTGCNDTFPVGVDALSRRVQNSFVSDNPLRNSFPSRMFVRNSFHMFPLIIASSHTSSKPEYRSTFASCPSFTHSPSLSLPLYSFGSTRWSIQPPAPGRSGVAGVPMVGTVDRISPMCSL